MTTHLTRRTALKRLFCGAACFGMPDFLVSKGIFSAYVALAPSQDYNPGYELGEKIYVPVRSSILNEDRTAEVILPPEFKADSDDRYDAIYILDGIRAYHYVAYDYLRGEGFIPKRTILVGLLGLKDTPTLLRPKCRRNPVAPTSIFSFSSRNSFPSSIRNSVPTPSEARWSADPWVACL